MIKKITILLLGVLLLFLSKSSFATHVAGSEMTYITTITQPGGPGTPYDLTFDFTLKVYRDCGGVALSNTQTVWYDFGFIDSTAGPILGNPNYVCNSCIFGNASSFVVTRDAPPTTIDLICSSQTANCDGGGVSGFEEHIYKGSVTITLPDLNDPNVFGTQPGKVLRFYFNDYARNNAINNVTSPGTKSLYNQVTFNARKAIKNFDDGTNASTTNGSPVVTQKPVFYGCVNKEINFSNIAIDAEGHTIRYFLVNPLYIDNPPPTPPLSTAPYLPLNIPFSGAYNYLTPWDVSAGFNLNNLTGQLGFTPTSVGNFIFSIVLVEMDTNGGVLGTTMRDYQFVIENCSNPITPNVSGPDFDTTTYRYEACYNQPFCFDVLGKGTGTIANVLRYNNEIDTSLSPLNSFIILSQNSDSTVARFCWDPGTFTGTETFTITSELDICPYKQFGTFTYTIVIDTNYNAICQDSVVYLDSNGLYVIDSTYVWDTAVTNTCDIFTIGIDKDTFLCADLGINVVNVTTTFVNGVVRYCTSNITVLDTISPTISCLPATLYLDATGLLVIDTTGLISSVSDNCSLDSVWVNVNDTLFGCVDTGTNTVTIYAQDESGNIDSCVSTITVLDTISPTITCLPATLYLDATGSLVIDTTGLISSVNDNCSLDSVWVNVSDTLFGCADTGMNSVTIYVLDPSGNIDSCVSTITILDTIAPTITCLPATLYLDATGILIIDTTGLISSTGDNCSVDSIWVNVNDTLFGCADTGLNTVTIYVQDPSGNIDSCISNLTVLDTINPVAICKDTTVYLDVLGNYTIDSSYIDNGSNDACGIQTITLSRYTFSCTDTGVNSVTMYVTDNNGNVDSCTSNVTVLDTVKPVVICIDTTIYLDASGQYTIDSSYIDGGSNDACGIYIVSQSVFNCPDLGPNNVTLYVNDGVNIDSCIAIVTVLDTIAPTITCLPATIYLDAIGQITIDTTGLISSTGDNCSVDSVWVNVNDTLFGCVDTGIHLVTIYVTDQSGNIDSCISTITVLDTTSPTITCLPGTFYLNATGTLVIDTTGLISSTGDNCSVDSVWVNVSDTLFGCIDTGLNTVTIYVQDPSGNIDSCISTITVLDTINPTISCLPATLYLDATGVLIIDTTGLISSTGDNCSVDSVWVNVSDTLFGCIDTGLNTVTIYVQDPSGNIDSCVSTITILDTIPPTITCLPATLYLDATGVLIIDTTGLISSTGDNCSVDSVWVNVNDTLFGCADTGLNLVTIYVLDPSGNIDSCVSSVTVLDTINPIVACKDTSIYLDAAGNYTIDSSYIENGSNDACGIQTITLSRYIFSCIDTGINSVTMFVTDNNGNVDSCLANVIVIDTTSPTAVCIDTTIYLDATGQFTIDSSFIDGGSVDACGVFVITQSVFDCSMLGANSVTLYATDGNNNIDSCTAIVTVLDTTSPSISCLPAIFYLDASGQVIIDTTGLIASVNDNCSIDSVWVNVNDTLFGCIDTGLYNATIYVMDQSGNMDSCVSIITILDTTSPTISCLPATFYLDATGQVIIDTTGLISSVNDNCSVDSVWVNVNDTSFGCIDTGLNTATIYVLDPSGNIDSCISTITVLDTTSPTISCLPATFYLDASGQLTIDTTGLIASVNDNCSVDSVWVNVNDTSFGCIDTGLNTATIYVLDPSGNIDSCVSTITILDTISPTISCLPATLYLDVNGSLIIDTTGLISSIGDNCSIDSVWVNVNDTLFGCADTGINNVTLYILDPSGNIDSCVSTITILDTINPVVICMDTTVYLDGAGNYIIDSSYIDNGSNDACGIQSITLNRYVFNCTDTGVNVITMYVTDNNGNIDSCMANVTVIDTVGPVAICQDTTIYLDASGQFTIDSSFVDGGSNDPCGIYVISQSLFNCSHIGPNNVTLYVYDLNSNVDSCVAIVTVLDTINPIVICKDTTLYLDATGQFVIDSSYIDNGSNDACGIATITVSNTTFTCADTGVNIITLYVTDNNGNTDSCTANVTIRDTIIPVATAGLDDSLCGIYTYNLNGNTPPGTLVGTWTTLNGPNIPAYSNINDPNSNVSSLIEGTYEFVWSVTNGPGCNVTRDTVSLYIYDVPVSNAGVDTGICNQFSLGLYANTPAGLSLGTWTYLTPSPTIPVFTNSNNPTTVVSNLDEGTYTLVWTVTNGSCVDAIDTMLLSVYETPVSNAGNDQSQCGRQNTIFLANSPAGTASGMWTNVSGPNAPTIVTPASPITTISNLTEGTYTFVWTVSNGVCTPATDTMQLFVYDSVSSNAGIDTNLCAVYNLNLYGNQPQGTAFGQWYIDPTSTPPSTPIFADSSLYNTNVSGLVEGTYRFLWVLQNGSCPFSVDSITINVWDNPSSSAGNDSSLCAIYNINMFADSIGGTSVGTWSLNPTYPNPNIPTIVSQNQYNTAVTGLIEGTYSFIWHVTNGPCYDYYDTVLITIYDQPTAIAGPDQFLCDLPSTNINAVPLTGSSVGTWYLANGTPNIPTFNPNTSSTTVSGMQEAGTYTLYYEAVNGVCPISRDTLVINNYPIPVVDFTQDTTEICQEDCIQFTNLSTIHPDGLITNYYWVIGGEVSTQTNPQICFPSAGLMDAQLIAESNNGCRDTTLRNNLIRVNNIPVADFNTFLVDDPNSSTKIQIQDNSLYSTQYWYSLGDGDTTTVQNPIHIYTDSGFYDITQIVTNDFGCADTLTKTIYVHILLVYVPNTFTPDGNGHNEKFFPVISGDDPDSYLFRIFDRWGELIFQSQNKNEKWDGTYKGVDCKTDTYVWTLRTKYKDGDRKFEYRGHVNLLR